MPRIKSAKKRLRQARSATLRNRTQRSQLRSAVKKVRAATTAEEATQAYRAAERLLDRSARKSLLHPNAAARQKSRLAKAIRNKG